LNYGQTVPFVPPTTPLPSAYYLALTNNFTTTSTSGTNTTLLFPGQAGETWNLHFAGRAQANTGNGMAYAIFAPPGATGLGTVFSSAAGGATSIFKPTLSGVNSYTTNCHTSGTDDGDIITVGVRLTASGNVGLSVRAGAAGTTATLFAGYYLLATKATP